MKIENVSQERLKNWLAQFLKPLGYYLRRQQSAAELRMPEVATYIGLPVAKLQGYARGQDMPPEVQRRLSLLLWGLDNGRVAKNCVEGKWALRNVDPALAQVAAAAGPQAAPRPLSVGFAFDANGVKLARR